MAKFMIPLLSFVVLMTGCSSDSDTQSDAKEGPERCTAEATEKRVSEADLSKMMEVAVDEPSRSALLTSIVKQCCPVCPEGSAVVGWPPIDAANACVACAATYSSGNPGEHINGCASKVCE